MSISRAQLAAALVEYDNEDAPPSERKNHRQSALFSFRPPQHQPSIPTGHLPLHDHDGRPTRGTRPSSSLGGQWGSDVGGHDSGRSMQSRRSVEMQPEPEIMEDVDVSRWDLPGHLISNDPIASSSSRPPLTSGDSLPNMPTKSASTPQPFPESSPFQQRAHSVQLDNNEGEFIRPSLESHTRRRTVSFDLERDMEDRRRTQSSMEYLAGADAALAAAERARALADMPRARSVMGSKDSGVREPTMIPLPTSPISMYNRPSSSMSLNRVRSIEPDLQEEEEDDTPNPFALPPPPISEASRFDPKVVSQQPTSPPLRTTRDTRDSTLSALSSRRLSTHLPSPLGPIPLNSLNDPSRPVYQDIPSPGEFGKPLIPPKYARRPPPDRHLLLRPRTLIMPTSLLGADYVPPPKVRDGFMLGEKPLPAGARSSILVGDGGMWNGRNSGMMPGQVGEIQLQGREFGKGMAMELKETEEEEAMRRAQEEEIRAERENRRNSKMPGKLYGTSLMDQLEARKQYTKSRSRVFTGDSRPSMFARQSTFLPGSQSTMSLSSQQHVYQASPPRPELSPQLHSTSPDKDNRQSVQAPLLQFDGNETSPEVRPRPGMPNSRSVYGVDALWEKEMAKLKIIQAEEEARRVERERKAAELAEKEKKKKGWLGKDKKGKGKAKERDSVISPQSQSQDLSPNKQSPMELERRESGYGGGISPLKNKLGDLPPTLRYSPEKATIPISSPPEDVARRPASRAGLDGWASEDEEDINARRRRKGKAKAAPPPAPASDSEDDIPLSRMIPPPSQIHINQPRSNESDSEDEVPLSRIAAPRAVSATSTPMIKLNSDVIGSLGLSVPILPPSISPKPPTIVPTDSIPPIEDDEDDRPLGLRPGLSIKSNLFDNVGPERTEAEKAEIEDDLPLGYKHAHAVGRQISVGSIPPSQSFSPYPQQQQWGMSQMGSMYGMGMMGYPNQPMGMPMQGYGGGYGNMMGPMGHMGMPMGVPLQGSGLPFFPQQQAQMGMMGPTAQSQQQGMVGLGPPPLAPGQNIDSWRKGVRAPSTAGTGGGV